MNSWLCTCYELTSTPRNCSLVSVDQLDGRVPFKKAFPSMYRVCRLVSMDQDAGSSPDSAVDEIHSISRLVSMLQLLGRLP